jgi:hypothetical protein
MKYLQAITLFFLFVTAALSQISQTSPSTPAGRWEGRWEGEIQVPRRPLVALVDFDTKQGSLGLTGSRVFPVKLLKADGEEIQFELHLGKETISFRAVKGAEGLRGTATVADLQGPFLLRKLAEMPPVHSREEAWRQDLDVVLTRFLPYDHSFSDAARAEARQRIQELQASVARRSDAEIMVELARAVALSGNAHTRLYLVRNRTEVRRLPIRVWWFRDALHVVRATEEHRQLLGCQVEKIGGMKAATAAGKVRGIKAGNASWQRYMSSYMLTSPEILVGSGVVHQDQAERIPFELRCSGKKMKRVLAPLPLRKSSESVEAWWDLSPFAKRNASTPLSALPAENAPLYLRKPDVYYWFEPLPQSRILYFQYNRSEEMKDGPSLADFGRELLAAAGRSDVEALVMDLRFNTGGNLDLATPLMKSLQEKLAGKKVFVITGRATFSAGISHTAQWKQWGAKIVGEPVGDELDAWGEGGNVELPHSKLTVHYANGFHGYSKRDYPERKPYFLDLDVDTLEPDVRVETTWMGYRSGRDPAMEWIEGEMEKGRSR